jgi:hypothetical protein
MRLRGMFRSEDSLNEVRQLLVIRHFVVGLGGQAQPDRAARWASLRTRV